MSDNAADFGILISRVSNVAARFGVVLAAATLAAASGAFAQTVGAETGLSTCPTGFIPPARGETLRVREISGTRRHAPLARTGDVATGLPSRWDSREKGWVSSVKSQGSFGTCWAFASLATLETQLLRKGLAEPDFSEKNLVNLAAASLSFNDGGNFDTAAGYLLRWSGPVAEANDPYVTGPTIWTDYPSPALAAEVHVRDVVWIPRLDGTPESRETLKAAIAAYGAVGVPVHWRDTFASTNTYYCHQANVGNHAIVVVGWDDAYPTNAFKTPPPGEGAWIIKNSWGRRYGDQGFYHVSYHDQTFGRDSEGAVFLAPDDDTRYSAVHGHDCGGPDYDTSCAGVAIPAFDCDLQAVVFTAAWAERLDAVGFWTRLYPNPCEISVYTNVTRHADPPADPDAAPEGFPPESASPIEGAVLACRQTTVLSRPGYTSVPLDTPIPLAPGTSYAVVVRQTGEEVSTVVNCHAVYSNAQYYADHTFARGNGYIGWTGEGGPDYWSDAYDAGLYARDTNGWALCVKAYTCSTAAVPAEDAPDLVDNGAAMLRDLASTHPALYAETFSFDALSALAGANGRSLWASWLAGLDPADPDDVAFTASISITNGVPCIEWHPDLGDSRSYTVWGCDALAPDTAWRLVDPADPGATGARFFKVSVGSAPSDLSRRISHP